MHSTVTCDPDTPHLITNVETTPAASPDDTMLAVMHASLATSDRLPVEHLVDKGNTDSQALVDGQRDYDIPSSAQLLMTRAGTLRLARASRKPTSPSTGTHGLRYARLASGASLG